MNLTITPRARVRDVLLTIPVHATKIVNGYRVTRHDPDSWSMDGGQRLALESLLFWVAR